MEKFNTGIYQIINQINGKRYVGSAKELTYRKRKHFQQLNDKKHHNIYLQRSYNKYGKKNFNFEILLYCDKENLIFYEQRAIDAYNFKKELYNISPIAGSSLGVKHSEKAKKNMSKSHIGRKYKPMSEEQKEKLRKANIGKKHTEEHKRKISQSISGNKNPMYGKKHTKETIKKLSKIKKGKITSEETKIKISKALKGKKSFWYGKIGKNHPGHKPIYQINKDTNEIIKKWYSIRDIERELNIKGLNISVVCNNGIQKTAGGFKWKFV